MWSVFPGRPTFFWFRIVFESLSLFFPSGLMWTNYRCLCPYVCATELSSPRERCTTCCCFITSFSLGHTRLYTAEFSERWVSVYLCEGCILCVCACLRAMSVCVRGVGSSRVDSQLGSPVYVIVNGILYPEAIDRQWWVRGGVMI